MFYDGDQARLELRIKEQEARAEQIREQLAESNRAKREAENKLKAKTNHENWHCIVLAYGARQAGFTGEDGEAFYYLKQMKPTEYVEAIRSVSQPNETRSIIDLEYAAVNANREEWTRNGSALHFERERENYLRDCAEFQKWQAENPDKTDWREKPATRRQYFLIWRTAQRLDIEQPRRVKRGEAHDWLATHDANLRFTFDSVKNLETSND